MNTRDTTYARYITIGAIAVLVIIAGIWIAQMFSKSHENTDPRQGAVCMDTQCIVKKECDGSTLLIKTSLTPNSPPTVQRVPNSNECQS